MTKGTSFLHKPPYHLLLAILGLYVFRFGYGYGFSDQEEFLPYLMRLLDPDLFTTDWFVNTQLSSFSIRDYFVYLLYGPAALLSPSAAVGILYLICWFAIASGLYTLALFLSRNKIAAIASVGIILVLTPFWTLGGNDLVHSVLVPSMLGWSLGLWAIVFFLKDRIWLAALVLGITTLFQALIGLQLGLVLGLVMIVQRIAKQDRTIKDILVFGLIYLGCAAPTLLPLFTQQFTSELMSIMPYGKSPAHFRFYVMAEFRAPHHYLFHSFDSQRMIQFAILSGAGLASLFLDSRLKKQLPAFFITSVLGIIFFLCVVAYAGTEVVQNLTITKLQLFKLTVLAKILLIIAVTTAIVTAIPTHIQSLFEKWVINAPGKFTLLFVLAYSLLIVVQADRFKTKVYPFSTAYDSRYAIYDWARSRTSNASIFATPPSWSGFRISAQRSIVINHKAYTFNDTDIYDWFWRLNSMAPSEVEGRTDHTLPSTLDALYEELSMEKLAANIDSFDIDYLVRATELKAPYPLLFSTDEWFVYGTELSEYSEP